MRFTNTSNQAWIAFRFGAQTDFGGWRGINLTFIAQSEVNPLGDGVGVRMALASEVGPTGAVGPTGPTGPSAGVSFGSEGQVPRVNAAQDDFDYSDLLSADESTRTVTVAGDLFVGVDGSNAARVRRLELVGGGPTSYLTSHGNPQIYRTGTNSNPFPFNAFGNLVLQARSDANAHIVFATGVPTPVARFRILNTGAVEQFDGANWRSNAYFIDGTWTPVITGTTTNPTVTYTVQDGIYSRIGNILFWSVHLETSAISGGSGQIRIAGLPFSSPSGNSKYYSGGDFQNIAFNNAVVHGSVGNVAGSSTLALIETRNNNTAVALLVGAWGAAGRLRASGFYRIN